MSVIATFTVGETDFAIGDAFAAATDDGVETESVVPVSTAVFPYFWLDGDASCVQRLEADSRVESVTVVDRIETRTLVRVDWTFDSDHLVAAVVDTEAVVLRAVRTGDRWRFKLRFQDYDSLSAFNRRCKDEGIDLELVQVHNPADGDGPTQYHLTAEQEEVLQAAIEEGYFEVPRDATLVDLGEQLGISDSAVSQRLRRGLSTLLAETLGENSGCSE